MQTETSLAEAAALFGPLTWADEDDAADGAAAVRLQAADGHLLARVTYPPNTRNAADVDAPKTILTKSGELLPYSCTVHSTVLIVRPHDAEHLEICLPATTASGYSLLGCPPPARTLPHTQRQVEGEGPWATVLVRCADVIEALGEEAAATLVERHPAVLALLPPATAAAAATRDTRLVPHLTAEARALLPTHLTEAGAAL